MILIIIALAIVAVSYVLLQFLNSKNNKIQQQQFQENHPQPPSDLELKQLELLNSTPNAPRQPPRPAYEKKKQREALSAGPTSGPRISIVFGTQSGTAELYAKRLQSDLVGSCKSAVSVIDVKEYEPETLAMEEIVILIFSTYTEGKPTPSSEYFYWWVTDEGQSERSGNIMRNAKFAVFGLGNSLYGDHYNVIARTLDRCLFRIGGQRAFKRGEGDESNDSGASFESWCNGLKNSLFKNHGVEPKEGEGSQGRRRGKKSVYTFKKRSNPKVGKVEEDEFTKNLAVDSDEETGKEKGEPLVDLEDLGGMMKGPKKDAIIEDFSASNNNPEDDDDEGDSADDEGDATGEKKQMISETQREVLTKQGYRVIGSHSGVKMCRWTKSMLRGRGGCYKHTFYGIASHRCMEMTPSMACANKCVFCWRHHKNPVGREWRWEMDQPEMIIEAAIDNHVNMIKQAKGVPGVKPERYEEGFKPRHCALSLVGEPIIYPEINKFLGLLHQRGISSFLVTNAQFPDKISDLAPVTQLYVSIDAATPESLKIVDRPLFADFWERFLLSIDALSKKGQRTVFRLTLVKGYNMEEVKNYGELIRRGKPDFVEIKGVTFSGGGKRNPITMKNIPWHHEVIAFSEAIAKEVQELGYEIASEHEHSCCILIANANKFKRDGKWYTWIDFDRFIELQASGRSFTSLDYMDATPEWAVFGHTQRGFDPQEFNFRLMKMQETGETSYNNSYC